MNGICLLFHIENGKLAYKDCNCLEHITSIIVATRQPDVLKL